jgi:tRNA1(Val) A37 N6-methylase TrmN6
VGDPALRTETTVSGLLAGRLVLEQPRTGHRAGTDAVLLAAAAPVSAGCVFADVGSGVGTVGLALALREPGARGSLIELQEPLARLALSNVRRNGLDDRVCVEALNVLDRHACEGFAHRFDLVVTNPPFYDAARTRIPDDPGKAKAYVLDPDATPPNAPHLGDWLRAAMRLLTPRGRLVMIHRPDALPEIFAATTGRLGAIAVRPVYAHLGRPAGRILMSGVAGSRGPTRIVDPLVLHNPDGTFTSDAEALHRGDRLLAW